MDRGVVPADVSRAERYLAARSVDREGEEAGDQQQPASRGVDAGPSTPRLLPPIAVRAHDHPMGGSKSQGSLFLEQAAWFADTLASPSAESPSTAARGRLGANNRHGRGQQPPEGGLGRLAAGQSLPWPARSAGLSSSSPVLDATVGHQLPTQGAAASSIPRRRSAASRSPRTRPGAGVGATAREVRRAFKQVEREVGALDAERRRRTRGEAAGRDVGVEGEEEAEAGAPCGAGPASPRSPDSLATSLEAYIAQRLLFRGEQGHGSPGGPAAPLLALGPGHPEVGGDEDRDGADGPEGSPRRRSRSESQAPALHAVPMRRLAAPVHAADGRASTSFSPGADSEGAETAAGAPEAARMAGRRLAERVARVALDAKELCVALDGCADGLPPKNAPTARIVRRATRTLAALFNEMVTCFVGVDAFRREWCTAAREWYALAQARCDSELADAGDRVQRAERAVEAMRTSLRSEEARVERLQRDVDTTTRVARDLRTAIAESGGATVKPRALPRPAHSVAGDAGGGKPGFSAAQELEKRNLDLEKFVDEGRHSLERSLGMEELRQRAQRTAWCLRHDVSVQTSIDDDADWDVEGGISLLTQSMSERWMLHARAPFHPHKFLPVDEAHAREPGQHLDVAPPPVWVSDPTSGRMAAEDRGDALPVVTLGAVAAARIQGLDDRDLVLVRGPWASSRAQRARVQAASGPEPADEEGAGAKDATSEDDTLAFDVSALSSLPPAVLLHALQRNEAVRSISGLKQLVHEMQLRVKGSQAVPAPTSEASARGADGTLQGESFADFIRRTHLSSRATAGGLRRRRRFLYSDFFLDFLANTPATAAAGPVESLAWVRNVTWEYYDEKSVADESDLADGAKLQALNVFVVEHALSRGDRPEAELALVRLLRALERHARDPRVALFSRFLGTHTKPLDTIVTTAFLAARRRLLRLATLHRLVERRRRASAEDVSGGQQDAAYRDNVYLLLGDQGGTNRRKSKGAHDKTAETDWVLVEHAVAVLFETLSFLPRARKEQIARDLAAGAGMRNRLTGGLLATDNSAPLRSAARAQIRRDIFSVQVDALLQDYAGTLDSPHPPQPIAHDREDAFEVVSHVDVVMGILANELEQRQGALFREMMRLFREGDTNGDGVLDFPEFLAILRNTSAKVSDRQALRMFREALTRGNNSATISQTAFVDVCVDHGLISLLETGGSVGDGDALRGEDAAGDTAAPLSPAQQALRDVEALAEQRRAAQSAAADSTAADESAWDSSGGGESGSDDADGVDGTDGVDG